MHIFISISRKQLQLIAKKKCRKYPKQQKTFAFCFFEKFILVKLTWLNILNLESCVARTWLKTLSHSQYQSAGW